MSEVSSITLKSQFQSAVVASLSGMISVMRAKAGVWLSNFLPNWAREWECEVLSFIPTQRVFSLSPDVH